MNLFKKQKPESPDVIYFENIFEEMRVTYNFEYQIEIEKFELLNSYEGLITLLEAYAKKLELSVSIRKMESIDEIEFDNQLPEIYEWEILDEETNETLIELTPFAIENPQIALCEVLLLLLDMKLKLSSSLDFDSEEFQDLEGFYKPFLVYTAIYFGFGFIFLKRHSIKTYYEDPLTNRRFNIVYRVPLHLKVLTYGMGFKLMTLNSYDCWEKEYRFIFNDEIQKEIKNALDFIKNGESDYYNWLKSIVS